MRLFQKYGTAFPCLGAVSLEEMVRVLYRLISAEGDPREIVKNGRGFYIRNKTPGKPNLKQPTKIDPETGEIVENYPK